jgi:hypothetical protein
LALEEWKHDTLPLPVELPIGLAETTVMFALASVALLFFFFSGIGWIISGHRLIGFAILFIRGYVSLGILAAVDSSGDTIRESAIFFSISMVMGAASVIGLILATRPRLGSRLRPSTE